MLQYLVLRKKKLQGKCFTRHLLCVQVGTRIIKQLFISLVLPLYKQQVHDSIVTKLPQVNTSDKKFSE